MQGVVLNTVEQIVVESHANLFVMSRKNNFENEDFVRFFMNSQTCKQLDMDYSHMCFAGESYIFEELVAESNKTIKTSNLSYSLDFLYWMGYLYRYWHYYT